MPSGKTHDAITLMLAVPTCAVVYSLTKDASISGVAAAAFVFGGVMFGPDLDTVSRQYSRWSVFRFLWLPYRRFFRHRSRFTHGLIFGAFGRVLYFMGVLTLAAFLILYSYSAYLGGKLPNLLDVASIWQSFGEWTRAHFGEHFFLTIFVGLWLGAASHTFTDMAGSFIKTGRIAKFL